MGYITNLPSYYNSKEWESIKHQILLEYDTLKSEQFSIVLKDIDNNINLKALIQSLQPTD